MRRQMEGSRAVAAIWEEERAVACAADPDTDCAEEVQLIDDV